MSPARNPLRYLLLLLVIAVAGCASTPTLTSDSDPQADFSGYRTFAFYSPLAAEPDGYATLSSGHLKSAARRELEARGYVYDEAAPDLLVNINAYMEERTDVVSFPYMGAGMYYGYRTNAYFASPYFYDNTSVRNYTEGTVNVDLVDADRKALVWEGMAVGRVSQSKKVVRTERINTTMAEIFAQYPHQAASR